MTRCCEATANEALIEAIKLNDIATTARVDMQAEVNRAAEQARGLAKPGPRKTNLKSCTAASRSLATAQEQETKHPHLSPSKPA